MKKEKNMNDEAKCYYCNTPEPRPTRTIGGITVPGAPAGRHVCAAHEEQSSADGGVIAKALYQAATSEDCILMPFEKEC
jgi:hypothetical protein